MIKTPRSTPPMNGPWHARLRVLAVNVGRGFYHHNAFDHAATMSFYFFLGLIPLFVFAGFLLGEVVKTEGAETLAAPLFRVMPAAAAVLIRDELHDIGTAGGTSMAPLSLFGFLVLTSNGIHNLMDVFELVLKAPHRPWYRQRIWAVSWVFVSLAVVLAAAWAALILDHALHDEVPQVGSELHATLIRFRRALAGTWERVGTISAFFGFAACGLAAFYRVAVKHPADVRRRVWPGTAVAMVCWILVSWAFGKYVTTIAHYAVYYGSLAAVAVLLFWLYLTSLAVLLGAEVNAQLEGVRERTAAVEGGVGEASSPPAP